MSESFPANARIAPERWYGEKFGHLSRHDQVALLRAEVEALCEQVRGNLNVFTVRKCFLNAGGKEEHWRRISDRLSALHPVAVSAPPKPVVRIPNGEPADGVPAAQPSQPTPRPVPPPAPSADDSYKRLGNILLDRGVITEGQLERALRRQLRTGERLGSILVATGTVDSHELAQALASQAGLLAVDLDKYPIHPAAVDLIPLELCEKHCMLPLKLSGNVVLLAMGNPSDADAYGASREALEGKHIRRVVAAEIQIERILAERKRAVRSR